MHGLHSAPFLLGLILLLCLSSLPRLIDASALQFSHELLPDKIAPDTQVSQNSLGPRVVLKTSHQIDGYDETDRSCDLPEVPECCEPGIFIRPSIFTHPSP